MIEVKGLYKSFDDKTVLSDINADFENGKTNLIIGQSGSGKTVLMKCICGFVRPTSGEVNVNGTVIGKDTDYIGDTGIIIENPGFIPYYSGRRNLKLLSEISRKADEEKIRATMELCGLEPDLKLPVRKYSLGMRQRLGIAQAIMEDPSILILDEPMNGLDREGVAVIRKLLLGLKEQGKLILVASHNREDIDILCDQVYEVEKGRVENRIQS